MEEASRQLMGKFRVLGAVLEKAPLVSMDPSTIEALSTRLSATELRFALTTSHLYVDPERDLAEFNRILIAEDFTGDADRLLDNMSHVLRSCGVPLRDDVESAAVTKKKVANINRSNIAKSKALGASKRPPADACAEIQKLIDTYPRNRQLQTTAVDYTHCQTCNVQMLVDSGSSTLKCNTCGVLRELNGVQFDDGIFTGESMKKPLRGPNRHYQQWIMHTLALEPEDKLGDRNDPDNQYGEKVIAAIKAQVAKDRQILRLLSVYEMRAILEKLTPPRTDLNKSVPLLLKKVTGIGPPHLSEDYLQKTENYFYKAVELIEQIYYGSDRANLRYYPFYIYKILDWVIPEADHESRRVLYYIYIQDPETVMAHDDDWRMICPDLGIEFKPTDQMAATMRYRPL